KRLYELIRKRTIASQMASAEIEKTKATIDISTNDKFQFIASGEVIKFDGFLKVYMEGRDDETEDGDQEGMLPVLKVGEKPTAKSLVATEKFKNHPPRYTEASLVKKMEELGIGRPSTYAPTISTVLKRGYIVKEDREGTVRRYKELVLMSGKISDEIKSQNTGAEKQKLFPTDTGMVVTDFLVANFENIMDYNFTANVEEEFDEIAEGKMNWSKMIGAFYGPFHETVAKTIKDADRQSGERELGIDPNSGKRVIARIGRFGAMVQIGQTTETEKPKFASLPMGKNIETITLEEALAAFAGPASLGEYQGEKVTTGSGRFGPYIKWKTMFVSIPKPAKDSDGTNDLSLSTITLEQAIPLIEKKIETEKNKNIQAFDYEKDKIYVLNGMYGPYIKYGKTNFRIPKGGKDATDLTLEDCVAIISAGKFGNKGGAPTTAGKKEEKEEKKPAKKAAAKKPAAKKTVAKKAKK
ncbi:MAG: DNA topoisomerase, partial [candidate division SR1 bacterium]|nr:DNA topoisomerase [candidate division SR1 bacterium]